MNYSARERHGRTSASKSMEGSSILRLLQAYSEASDSATTLVIVDLNI